MAKNVTFGLEMTIKSRIHPGFDSQNTPLFAPNKGAP